MAKRIYQITLAALLALGCALPPELSGDAVSDLEDQLHEVQNALCEVHPCIALCLPVPVLEVEVPAVCGVTCEDYPCQPSCLALLEPDDEQPRCISPDGPFHPF